MQPSKGQDPQVNNDCFSRWLSEDKFLKDTTIQVIEIDFIAVYHKTH